jgi:hypothetical protein
VASPVALALQRDWAFRPIVRTQLPIHLLRPIRFAPRIPLIFKP